MTSNNLLNVEDNDNNDKNKNLAIIPYYSSLLHNYNCFLTIPSSTLLSKSFLISFFYLSSLTSCLVPEDECRKSIHPLDPDLTLSPPSPPDHETSLSIKPSSSL